MTTDPDWEYDRHGDPRWQGILAHTYHPSGFSRPATPGKLVCIDCWEDEECPVHQPPPPQEIIRHE